MTEWRRIGLLELSHIKDTVSKNVVGLSMFVLVVFVLFRVPQARNLFWELPNLHDNQRPLPWTAKFYGALFWIYVPALLLYCFSFWLTLLCAAQINVARVLKFVTFVIVFMFVFAAPGLTLLWRDHFADWPERLFQAVVLFLVILYFFSWCVLLRPEEFWPERTKPELLLRLRSPFFREPVWPVEKPEFELLQMIPRLLRHLLIDIALPLILLNLLLFALHSKKCGKIVNTLDRIADKWPTPVCVVCFFLGAIFLILFFVLDLLPFEFPRWHQGVMGLNLLVPALLCAWLAFLAWRRMGEPPSTPIPIPLHDVTGRVLMFFLVGFITAELIWAGASLSWFDAFCSYRIYTIAAMYLLGFGLIAAGTWVDVLQDYFTNLPVRLATVIGLFVAAWLLVAPTPLQTKGQQQGNKIWDDAPDKDSLNWYKHVKERLEQIDKTGSGPVVVVAVSGGGSRAALFSSLVFQALENEDFDLTPPEAFAAGLAGSLVCPETIFARCVPKAKWKDRILLISSVSGGSLATADFVFRDRQDASPRPVLQNTLNSELTHRFAREYNSIKNYYSKGCLDKKLSKAGHPGLPKLSQPFSVLYDADEVKAETNDSDLDRIFTSAFVDDMCTDFMAPILRGAGTLTVDRGESLSRFWQHRLHWPNVDNITYHDPSRPLVIFNATDAQYGNRVLLGFPQLPRRVGMLHLSRIAGPEIMVRGTLSDVNGLISVTNNTKLQKVERTPNGNIHPTQPVKKRNKFKDSGNSNAPTHYQIHEIKVRKGTTYVLDMKREGDKNGKKLDPFLFLTKKKDLTIIAQDDDSGGSLDAQIRFTADERGLECADGFVHYEVYATAYSGNTDEGEYKLILRKAPRSLHLPESKSTQFNPHVPYTHSLADFWPCFHLDLRQAVRASANFPWGFQSGMIQRCVLNFDFKKKKYREVLDNHVEDLVDLLPDELNLLDLDQNPNFSFDLGNEAENTRNLILGKQKRTFEETFSRQIQQGRAEAYATELGLIVSFLEQLSRDAHAAPEARAKSEFILKKLQEAFGADHPPRRAETMYLLDGGVNDNTGIATVAELLLHLEAVGNLDDPLVSKDSRKWARQVMNDLRQRGVIFLEIDSNGRPESRDDTLEFVRPLQALKIATDALGRHDRDDHLRRMNELLAPAWERSFDRLREERTNRFVQETNASEYVIQSTFPYLQKKTYDEGQRISRRNKEVPWMLSHSFICSLGLDRDVMTAWALGPDEKAHIMATFFCELQKWRHDQRSAITTNWLTARNVTLFPKNSQPYVRNGEIPKPLSDLDAFRETLDEFRRVRIEQQADIQRDRKKPK